MYILGVIIGKKEEIDVEQREKNDPKPKYFKTDIIFTDKHFHCN